MSTNPPIKDTFTVTFDGKAIEVPKNLNLIDAAKLAGIDIPHFCFHPRLSVVGQCRMCLVEIEGIPKIQAACTTPLREGLAVKTTTDKVKTSRAATMEFLLINHPLDCPICDQAGECTLQDNSFGYGEQLSRYDEAKRQYPTFDRTMIGPHVVADMTRCIQCTRCIRFCQEIAGTSELTFLDRGGRTLVWTHDGKPLANDWSGCAADVCPVGALTTREFRFRSRVWYLQKTKSVCPGCNVGCNISIESKDDVVYRFLPRLNPEVNDYWLCDHGRFLSESLNPRDVHKASIREGNDVRDAIVPVAIERAAREIRAVIEKTGPAGLFFLGSAHLSNEENFLLRKLADHLACPNRDVVVDKSRVRKIKSKTEWVEGDDAAPNFRGARDMGLSPGRNGFGLDAVLTGKASPEVIVISDAGFAALADDPEKVAVLRKARFLVVAARNGNALTRSADVVLPAASLSEKGRHVHERPGPRPEVRARVPAQAPGARALGAPPDARDRARLRRPQLDARGSARADRRRGRGLQRRQGAGARGRSAPEEG